VKGNNKAVVKSILPGSIAEEAEIQPGDTILSINGENIGDVLDYRFLTTDRKLIMEVLKPDGEIWEIEIEKDEYEDPGIEFEDPMISGAKSCVNKCIFCFIDQLPEGMRDTLYFKDDDTRLSFLTGNYVTLTNVSFKDIGRIVKYRMSPINVSVHTTDPELRKFMLSNRYAGDVLDKIKALVDGGITVNCQVVLCRGVNEGNHLDRTIADLVSLYPGMRSLSVVPAGITRHRQGLYNLIPYDRESSLKVVGQVEDWQGKLYGRYGSHIVFLADEFYIMAGEELPDYKHYEDFPQIENGVGLVPLLKHEFNESIENAGPDLPGDYSREVSIATGVSVVNYINEMVKTLEKRYNKLKVDVYEIKNRFFGENVTVAGLLTGRDLISQLKGKELGEELLISNSMLKAGEKVFLDDVTVDMLEKELGVKVTAVWNSGRDFLEKVLGIRSIQ